MAQLLPRFTLDLDLPRREARRALDIDDVPFEDPIVNPGAGQHGDTARLRGIPVIGGASGVQPGTSPHQALVAKERQRERESWKAV